MLLRLDKLSVSYGRFKALDNVSVSLDSKALGLLGPNGAGKSTLIRAILGLVRTGSGKGMIEGLDIHSQGRTIREQIGYMPEHDSYLAGMTAVRFLRYMGEVCGLSPRAAMERAHEVLFYVGLGEVRYRPLEGLSYGMRQKVRLAQALIHGPNILILDEPTNGLDPAAREEMLTLITETIEKSDSKVIMSSHLLKDIEVCCRDVLVLKRGHAVASGNIDEMKQTDRSSFRLRIKGQPDAFMAALSEQGSECQLNNLGEILVTLPDSLDRSAFFKIAQAQQVQIRHFYEKKDSLEDIFLKVLEDEEPQEEPTPETSSATN